MMLKSVCIATVVALGLAGPPAPAQNFNPQQNTELTRMNADLASLTEALATARTGLAAAVFAERRNNPAIQAKADAVGNAELALARARADGFARIQASPNKLASDQVAALIAMSGGAAPTGRGRAAIPNITQRQLAGLTQMNADLASLMQSVTTARTGLATAVFAEPRNNAAIEAKAVAVRDAELVLALARADAFARMQASPGRLAPDQVAAVVAMGGALRAGLMPFTQPEPLDFSDHEGYVSLFDGVGLKGWDGNPKFWRAEDGAIVGESTPTNPSGNTYIVYRGLEARDFTLKFEIKIEGSGGSGFQYRSKTGLPWLAPIAPNVTANVGPVNLNWMMTGPQADFWPSSRDYTGQFYSENTPMRIMSWRGQVVEGAGLGTKRLMGNIGDRQALNSFVKMDDWNQYTVIARGGTFIHIVNGQLMAVMVDDDPNSSNNQSGLFGIEIEATTKVSVRNIWLKKLN